MKNVLVTGGAGFIGSHTCLLLLEKGYNVFVIDSFVNSSPKSLNKVLEIYKLENKSFKNKLKIFTGDLLDTDFLNYVFLEIIKKYKIIDGVIHLAGLKSVSESLKKPLDYWQVNVVGTINLLSVMSKYDCRTLVFSSSATIYENKGKNFISEDSPLKPINPYGYTKLTVEFIIQDSFNVSDKKTKFASLRYFNPIGAHPSGMIGENPKGKPNNIFPLIINTALGIQKELMIFGRDWPTSDGTPIRDYIHVMDLAEAHINVLENLFLSESRFLKLNIGTGIGTSVMDLVKTFERVNDLKVPFVFTKRRIGDDCHVVADNTLLISEFNFKPKRSLEDMCRDGWKWKSLNPDGF